MSEDQQNSQTNGVEKKPIHQTDFNMKEEAQQMMWESFLDEVLPRVQRFIPFLRKKLIADHDFLAPGEIIVIGKEGNGDFVVLKFMAEDGNVDMPADDTKREVDNIDSLLLKLFRAKPVK